MDTRCDFIPQVDGRLDENKNSDFSIGVPHSTSHGRGKHIEYMNEADIIE